MSFSDALSIVLAWHVPEVKTILALAGVSHDVSARAMAALGSKIYICSAPDCDRLYKFAVWLHTPTLVHLKRAFAERVRTLNVAFPHEPFPCRSACDDIRAPLQSLLRLLPLCSGVQFFGMPLHEAKVAQMIRERPGLHLRNVCIGGKYLPLASVSEAQLARLNDVDLTIGDGDARACTDLARERATRLRLTSADAIGGLGMFPHVSSAFVSTTSWLNNVEMRGSDIPCVPSLLAAEYDTFRKHVKGGTEDDRIRYIQEGMSVTVMDAMHMPRFQDVQRIHVVGLKKQSGGTTSKFWYDSHSEEAWLHPVRFIMSDNIKAGREFVDNVRKILLPPFHPVSIVTVHPACSMLNTAF